MAVCFSFTATRDRCLCFSQLGLMSTLTDHGDGMVMHCWVPRRPKTARLDVLLLHHGIEDNTMWRWNDFVAPLATRFDDYASELVFFGDSYTTRPEQSELFQAQCAAALMEAMGVEDERGGDGYGGFVAYSMAVQFGERVDKLVLIFAGVCLEDKDMKEGMFSVRSVDEAVSRERAAAQQPEKVRGLIRIAFHRPPKRMPPCFLQDLIMRVTCLSMFRVRCEICFFSMRYQFF